MSAGLLGCMLTRSQGNRLPDGALYACDNERFGSDGSGKHWPGHEAWFAWLARTVERYGPDRCLFAVAPDRPFDAVGTLTESRPWLAAIRDLGIPAAFAAQNGTEDEARGLIPWGEFDVLFLAGDTEWKIDSRRAGVVAARARARGLKVHMGRVSSLLRSTIAALFGCDTVDGTYLTFGPDKNLPNVLAWTTEVNDAQLPMQLGEAS